VTVKACKSFGLIPKQLLKKDFITYKKENPELALQPINIQKLRYEHYAQMIDNCIYKVFEVNIFSNTKNRKESFC
jgi:hypothetical protein